MRTPCCSALRQVDVGLAREGTMGCAFQHSHCIMQVSVVACFSFCHLDALAPPLSCMKRLTVAMHPGLFRDKVHNTPLQGHVAEDSYQ